MMRKAHTRGFTLVELLVVITIIGILTALTLGAAKIVQDKAARARAQGEVAAIDLALERYKIDNGDYPAVDAIAVTADHVYDGRLGTGSVLTSYEGTKPTSFDGATGIITGGSGGRLLFAELMGRTQLSATTGSGSAGTTLIAANRTQYIELKANQVNKDSTNTNGNYMKDPWGFPYGYFYKPAAAITNVTNANAKSAFNEVVPDFWSTSGETLVASPATTASGDDKARYLRWTANWANK